MLAVSCVSSMAVGLWAMHKPGLSTFFSGIGIYQNVFLNWVLILVNLGFPAQESARMRDCNGVEWCNRSGDFVGWPLRSKHLLAFKLHDIKSGSSIEKVVRFKVGHRFHLHLIL